MAARNYSNTGSDAEAAVLVDSGDTSTALANYSGFPNPPFIGAFDPDTVDEEVVLVTAVIGSTITMTRAYDGTTAKSHAAGASFRHVASALDFQEANDHVNASGDVHGVTGNLVGTTSSQTLTNKTLTSPTMSNPTVTGTLTGATADFSGGVQAGTVATDTTLSVGSNATITGTATAANLTATETVTGADLVATDDLTVGDDASIAGDLAVTGTVTAATATVSGTVTGGTVVGTTVVPSEIELVQTASTLTPASGRSSLFAKTDFGLHFTPNGQTQRRVSMHWGSGTTLPTTGAIAGDTYIHTGLASSMLRYNGTTWRQIDGPVNITNMAARPTHADLHAGFQVFSTANDDVYTYDGTFWRNAGTGGFTPSGAGAGDYITFLSGVATPTPAVTTSLVTISTGHTFSAGGSNVATFATPGDNASSIGMLIGLVGSNTTTSIVFVARTWSGTAVSGAIRVNWQCIGYND